MRILYLNYSTNNLATMLRCLELARAASLEGHQVTLCFMHRRFSPPAFFLDLLDRFRSEALEIQVLHSTAFSETPRVPSTAPNPGGNARPRRRSMLGLVRQALVSFRYVKTEIRIIRSVAADVVVARPDQIFSFLVSIFLTRRPLVLSTDGPAEELRVLYGMQSRLPVILDAFRLRRARAILYVSGVCGDLLRRKGLPPERLFYCPNGADPEFFKPLPADERKARRAELGLEGSTVLGFSGNQVGYHGVGEFLQTCVPLLQKRSDLKVLIVGTLKAEHLIGLETLPPELRVGRIIMTGAVPYSEMPAMIDCADIMVMPYPRLDLFFFSPMKMFEGLSMGKPIVASRQGQIPDVLEGLPCAFLYDPGEPAALQKAILQALDSCAGGLTGAASRELLCREHTWQARGAILVAACRHALAHSTRKQEAALVSRT